MTYKYLLIIALSLFMNSVFAKRVALVMGNDNYQYVSRLAKAKNDADAIAKELKESGFSVQLHKDVNYKNMVKAVEVFLNSIDGGDEVVVFYAGHGVQLKNGSFLLPVDIEAETEGQIEKTSYGLNELAEKLAETKANFSLIVIDACRDNPIKSKGRSVGNTRGLNAIEPARGQMIVYSASRGQIALDRLSETDSNPNGVFTREFISRMKKNGVKIEDIIREVQDAVESLAKSVGHAQRPALYNEARGNFYFSSSSKVIETVASNSSDPITTNKRKVESVIYIEGEQVLGNKKNIIKYIKENGVWTQYVNNYIFTTYEETARGFNSISLKDGYRNIYLKFIFDNEIQAASIYFKNNEGNVNWVLAADQYKVFPRNINTNQSIEQQNIKSSENQYVGNKDSEKVFSDVYKMRVVNRIKPNIVFLENPKDALICVAHIKSSAQGQILSSSLVKSSGNDSWDKAILKAIKNTELLPANVDGTFPELLEVSFSTK